MKFRVLIGENHYDLPFKKDTIITGNTIVEADDITSIKKANNSVKKCCINLDTGKLSAYDTAGSESPIGELTDVRRITIENDKIKSVRASAFVS